MRLISQYGTKDVPYEQTALVVENTIIRAYVNETVEVFAEYDSRATCLKVLEILRTVYERSRPFFYFPTQERIEEYTHERFS